MTPLQQMAADRMIKGKVNHPDQNWDDMTHEQLMVEAREELADCYNYFDKAGESTKDKARLMLNHLWELTK